VATGYGEPASAAAEPQFVQRPTRVGGSRSVAQGARDADREPRVMRSPRSGGGPVVPADLDIPEFIPRR